MVRRCFSSPPDDPIAWTEDPYGTFVEGIVSWAIKTKRPRRSGVPWVPSHIAHPLGTNGTILANVVRVEFRGVQIIIMPDKKEGAQDPPPDNT
jgi:hypothetical protein